MIFLPQSLIQFREHSSGFSGGRQFLVISHSPLGPVLHEWLRRRDPSLVAEKIANSGNILDRQVERLRRPALRYFSTVKKKKVFHFFFVIKLSNQNIPNAFSSRVKKKKEL